MCPDPAAAEPDPPGSTEPEPTLLLHPADGMPELCVTAHRIAAAAEQRGRALTQALNLAKELALEMSQIHRRRAELMEPADG